MSATSGLQLRKAAERVRGQEEDAVDGEFRPDFDGEIREAYDTDFGAWA